MPINFTLRPAVRQDAPAIRRLIWRARINPTRLDWRHFILAVDKNGKLLGSGQIKPHRDGTNELASIAVQPEARRLGIAGAVQVSRVEPGSLAALAGIGPGTLILETNRKAVTTPAEFAAALGESEGSALLTLYDNGRARSVTLRWR